MKIFLLITTILLLCFSARCKKKYTREFLRIMVCICFSLLIALSDNADKSSYEEAYYSQALITSNAFEIGYSLLSYIFMHIGFSYFLFEFCLSFIALRLINSTVNLYCKKPEIVYLIYIIYPLMMDATQFRNFLCMSILIYAIRFLVSRNKYWLLKYYVCIIIALSFHNIALIASIVPLAMWIRSKSLFSLWIAVVLGLVFVYSPLFVSFASWCSLNIFHKPYAYFNTRPDIGLFVPIFMQLGMTIAVCYKTGGFHNRYPIKLWCKPNEDNAIAFNATMRVYFEAAIIFIVLYGMTSHLFRAFRNMYILAYIVIINKSMNLNYKDKQAYIIFVIVMLIATWLLELYKFIDTVVLPFVI